MESLKAEPRFLLNAAGEVAQQSKHFIPSQPEYTATKANEAHEGKKQWL